MTKRVMTLLGSGLLCLTLAAAEAWADKNSSNDSGTFSVKIIPNVDLGVLVNTSGAAWAGDTDLYATMDLGTEKLLGRVVSTTAIAGPTHGCILVYVCRGLPTRANLLLPPMMTTRAPWSRGYFEHVRSQPLLPGEYFERHGFRDAHGRFVDEEGRPLDAPVEPMGECKIWEVAAIEEAIAAALAAAP